MKVCPVCQYEEGEESEVSCAICGSDLESTSVPSEDSDSDNTEVEEETTDTNEEISESTSDEVSEMTEEEKEIEAALAATEIPTSDNSEGFEVSKYLSFFCNFKTLSMVS